MTKNLFVNISNHPSTKWSTKQMESAKTMGEVVDIPFPNIDPSMTTAKVKELAHEYFFKVLELKNEHNAEEVHVHLMGEMTFTYNLVSLLTAYGLSCYAATTKRNVVENADGTKVSVFEFVTFRKY